MFFSFILDDRIICSWWLGILNVRFNGFSATFDVLIKILESYRPQIPTGAYMAKVLHEVLVDYNLTDKVRNVLILH